MNIFDDILARIPLTEVTIKTTLPAYAVMERVDYGVRPCLMRRQRSQYFTFEGSSEGNYFKIQGHLTNPNGKDAFPRGGYIGIAFIGVPLNIETSPTFYGRVFNDGEGAIIRGHFAVPFPMLSLLVVMLLLVLGWMFPRLHEISLGFSLFMVMWSIMSLIEYVTERKGILDFLQGLFFGVIKK